MARAEGKYGDGAGKLGDGGGQEVAEAVDLEEAPKDPKSCEAGFVFVFVWMSLIWGGCPVPSCRPMRHCEPLHLLQRGAKQPNPC